MRVIHNGSCNVLAGGPALSTWLTIKGLRNHGVETELIMEPVKKGKIISESIKPIYSSEPKFGSLAYVPGLNNTLDKIGLPDLYHIQGIWMLQGTKVARYARKHNIPYVVTLRGALYPQALAHNSLIKKISMSLYQTKTLSEAAAIQVTCTEEMDHYRALGFTNPVAVIPNPIDVDRFTSRPLDVKSGFRIGYLGRVHPRKRIERLIYALDNLRSQLPDEAELLIIGGGDKAYEDFLKAEVVRLKLGSKVKFTGFITGEDKDKAVDSLTILVVPSDFENFGNVVTEALVRGIPVISSKGTPWKELPENGCGWWIENDQESINKAILEAYEIGNKHLCEMGRNGRELMVKNYSVAALGNKMKSLYQWILHEAPQPEFVYTCE